MELIVTNHTFELPSEISNFDELRQSITPTLDFYKSLVVTEDGIREAKDDRSKLNNWKKQIETERKKIKTICLAPYKEIETKINQLNALIDEPITIIDQQLQAFDEKSLQEKKNVLEEHFTTENTLDFIAFGDVLPVKWKNKTEKTESLKAEISAKLSALKSDFAHLQNMYRQSPLWTAIYLKFAETKDKAITLAYVIELERLQTHLKGSVSDSVSGNVTIPVTPQTAVTNDSETVSGAFKVTCSISQLKNLRDFMLQQGIKFKVIKEETQ